MVRKVHLIPFCWLCVLGVFLATAELPAATPSTQVLLPLNKVGGRLLVAAPPGLTQVTLECKSGDGWKPLSVQYVAVPGKATKAAVVARKPTSVFFAHPHGYALSQLRVMASVAKFPSKFVSGQKSFSSPYSTPWVTADPRLVIGPVALNSATVNVVNSAGVAVAEPPTAVEPDIWKIIGDKLFFFNQYRGLQVFDVSNGQSPVRTGTLRLPAAGDQFFALDSTGAYLALLGRDQSAGADPNNPNALFVLSVAGGSPALVARLPIQGSATESRLVGTRLYVASTIWTSTNYQWGAATVLQGFDLSNPQQPVALNPLSLEGYNPMLQAADQTLLVATSDYADWYHSRVHVVSINNLQGMPSLAKTLTPKGRIDDKFKLNVSGDNISVVSFVWNWLSGGSRQTWVETFPLAGNGTAPLAQLHLLGADGESLHATRFDGDRLYVVTFRNVDPLFVVDLSNPLAPAVKGHVEIPGWSTYIQPFGDRLLTVGVEGGKVAISLFDVADPSAPSLLSRVTLGEGYSWSEANYDEKAVGFFPDQGVLLVPYQTSSSAGWQSATGVLTVDSNAITYRSSINHEFTARRAALVGDKIISISGQELIVEGAADLSALQLLAQLSIAWKVDRVIPFGSTNLIQIEDGGFGYYGILYLAAFNARQGSHPMLRISRADDPDALLEEVDMGPGQVIGTARKGGRLYVGQLVPGTGGSADLVRTWVFDISAPPALPEITHVDSSVPPGSGRLDPANAQALWPNDSTLVWHLPVQPYWGWGYWDGPIAIMPVVALTPASVGAAGAAGSAKLTSAGAVASTESASLIAPGRFGQSGNVSAVVFPSALENPDAPVPLAPVAIAGSRATLGAGSNRAFAGEGFLFASYDEDVPAKTAPGPTLVNAIGAATILPIFPTMRFATRSWLEVLDFRRPGNPVVRDRTSIPGPLLAVSDIDDRGAVLLTSISYGDTGWRRVQASAYDGVCAYLVDTLNSRISSWTASTSDSGHLFFARDGGNPGITSIGFNASTGRIVTLGSLTLAQTPQDLAVSNGFLLASSWSKLDAAAVSPAGALALRASFGTPTNLWIRVSRAGVDPNAGIWLPEGDFGVDFLGFSELLPGAVPGFRSEW